MKLLSNRPFLLSARHLILLSTFIFQLSTILLIVGCKHETKEEKAAKEAKEYTHRNCPTPVINNSRTDSLCFDTNKKEFIYYCSFSGLLDDPEVVELNRQKIHNSLRDMVLNNIGMKTYVEDGFKFRYVIHSDKNPEVILFEDTFN